MSDERLSFEAAAQELGISEGELESLAAEGKLPGVKDGDSLFFSKADVERYKSQSDDDSILLSDEEIDLLEDDAEVDFGIELEDSPVGTGDKDKTDEISLDDDVEIDFGIDTPEAATEDDTVLSLDGALEDDGTTPTESDGLLEDTGDFGDETLLDTDVLDIGEDDTDTFDLDTAEETLIDPAEEGTLLRGGGARVMQMKRKQSHAAWTAVLAVAALVMLLPLGVLLAMTFEQAASLQVQEVDGKAFAWIEKYNFLGDVVRLIAAPFK